MIRGIIPLKNKKWIFQRISERSLKNGVLNGPGKVTKALGINKSLNGVSLLGNQIWIEDDGIFIPQNDVLVGPRIGVDYAGEDALLPYRFLVKNVDSWI